MKLLTIEEFKGRTLEGIKTFLPGDTFELREDKANRLIESGKVKPIIEPRDNRMLFVFRVQKPCEYRGMSYLPGDIIRAYFEDMETLLRDKSIYVSCYWSESNDLPGHWLRDRYEQGIK